MLHNDFLVWCVSILNKLETGETLSQSEDTLPKVNHIYYNTQTMKLFTHKAQLTDAAKVQAKTRPQGMPGNTSHQEHVPLGSCFACTFAAPDTSQGPWLCLYHHPSGCVLFNLHKMVEGKLPGTVHSPLPFEYENTVLIWHCVRV